MDIPQDKMALITLLAIDRVRIENALQFYSQTQYEGLTFRERETVLNALSGYRDKIRLQISEAVNDLLRSETPASPPQN